MGFNVGGAVGGAVSGATKNVTAPVTGMSNPQEWAKNSAINAIIPGGNQTIGAFQGGMGGQRLPGFLGQIQDGVTGAMGGGDKPNPYHIDPGSKPELGGFTSSLAGDNAGLNSNALLNPAQIQHQVGNTQALDAMRSRATSTGQSPWMNMQLQKQGLEQNNAMNSAVRQAQSGQAGALSNLAMRGGLSSGASERANRFGAQDLNAARQGVQSQGMMARNQIGIADDAQKTALLGQTAGLDANAANAQNASNQFNANSQNQAGQFNIQNYLGQQNLKNQYEMDKYKTAMGSYGAANTANAIAAGGGGAGKK